MTDGRVDSRTRKRGLVALVLGLALLGTTFTLTRTASAAQVTQITGAVREETGNKVPAHVTLFKKHGNSYFEHADSDGSDFDFPALPEGLYQLQADFDGCTSGRTDDLQVPGPDSTLQNIDLRISCDYVPVAPKRVLETRPFPYVTTPSGAVRNAGNQVTSIKVRDDNTELPSDVTAVVLTVTGVNSNGPFNWLTVWDCSDQIAGVEGVEPDPPFASNVNLEANDVRANTVITRIGTGNADDLVCIYARQPTDLVVDLTGYYPVSAPARGELAVSPVPNRVLDTRQTGGGVVQTNYSGGKPTANQVIRVDLGGAVDANVLNVTLVDGSGWVTAWDCTDHGNDNGAGIEPDPPRTSSVNVDHGLAVANLVLAKSDENGHVCFYTSAPMNVIVDTTGFFPLGSRFTAATPTRVLETRPAPIGAIPPHAVKPGTNGKIVLDLAAAVPQNAKSVILNLTGTDSNTGYVTVYPCQGANDPVPLSSSLNLKAGQTRAALIIAKLGSSRRVCIVNQHPTHLVADLVGWYPVDPAIPNQAPVFP